MNTTKTTSPRYFDTKVGRIACQVVNHEGRDMVSIWVPNGAGQGLWDIERFGGALNAAGVRKFTEWATA